jgi:hypothetical protein
MSTVCRPETNRQKEKMSTGKYNHSLYTPSIDSFKWRIELDRVDIIDRNLLDHIVNVKTNTTTGEVIEETPIQANSLKVPFDGYHIHFGVQKIFGVQYLVVLVNSKLLEHDYLNGITMTNIEPIYNKIMSCKVFELPFLDFLSIGQVSDIDIKKDIKLSSADFKESIKHLEKGSKPQKRAKHGVNAFTQKDNLGIEWNTRTGGSYSHPFLKIYHKGIEALCSKNKDYFAQYIDVHEVQDRVRIECTLKSFREAQKHGFKDNTLLTLLKATTNDLNAIIDHAVTSNLEPRLKKTKTKDGMSNTELVYFLYLTTLIRDKGVSFQTALEYTLEHQSCKVQRTRLKNTLTAVYEEHIQNEKYVAKTEKMNSFFEVLGWK